MRSNRVHHPAPSRSLSDLLDDWVDAGLITREQALSIGHHEAGSPVPRAALTLVPTGPAGPSLVVEALGYLGGVVMTVGALILVGLYWSDLPVAPRLVLVGGTALALVGAGFAMPDLGEAAGRLRSVLWAAAVVASCAFFTVLSNDVLHRYDEHALIVIGPATAAVAALLWWRRPTWLQQLALFGPVLLSAVAVGIQLTSPDSSAPGFTVWAVAVTWTLLAGAGWLSPRVMGVSVGVLGAVFGALIMNNDLGIALGLLTAVAMVALSLRERSLPWLGVAAIAMLYVSPRAAVEWFPGRLSAALTLIVTGGALVGAAVWVARHQAGEPPS